MNYSIGFVRKEIMTSKKIEHELGQVRRDLFFASPDGRVVTSGVASLLVVASTIQVLLITIHNNLTSQNRICVVLFWINPPGIHTQSRLRNLN
jgi:hypothetical protein